MSTHQKEWVAKFGDPRDVNRYLTLDEINDGLQLVEQLKPNLEPDGELVEFFGLHPPSITNYADDLAGRVVVGHPRASVVETAATLWMDGLISGLSIMLLISARAE